MKIVVNKNKIDMSELKYNVGDQVKITRALEGKLNIFSLAEWELLSNHFKNLRETENDRTFDMYLKYLEGGIDGILDANKMINSSTQILSYLGMGEDETMEFDVETFSDLEGRTHYRVPN